MKNSKRRRKGLLFFYGLPAYGHTLSNLYLAGRLAEAGFRVVYFSAEPFRKTIEGNGCEYRAYPMDWTMLDLTDGERILKLYRLILEYTWKMLPKLLREAEKENPCAVIFDSLAMWGRAVAQLRSLPSFAFYSIAAIDWTWGFSPRQGCPEKREKTGLCATGGRYVKGKHFCLPPGPWGKGLDAYVPGFSAGFLRYTGEIPRAVEYGKRLKKRYGLKDLGLLPVLMNRGDYNLCGYSRLFQPGGRRFGQEYRFVGPLSVHRRIMEHNDFSCPDMGCSAPLIYISLGTVFNENEELLQRITEHLGGEVPGQLEAGNTKTGSCSQKPCFHVVLVYSGRQDRSFPENFTVRPFVNQNEVLRRASLFITAGGVNSIHEALYFGVPCLLCPQQGEQRLNAKRFEKLGFGRILRDSGKLRQEAMECMELKRHWDERRRKQMTGVSLGKVLELFKFC